MTDVEWNEDEKEKDEYDMAPDAGFSQTDAGERENVNNWVKGR